MIVTCKVIEDLLPLYADGICSEDTKTVVEHHTAECAECRKKLEAMTSDTAEPEKSGEKKPSPENPFKKLRRHYTRLVICTLLICAAVMIPSALVFRLYVNEETNNKGMSF
ncbi:MAG: zf-HC2 domain-containing protein, partial [Oscillospiraceae bacterium]|nr:zf-HC2 domain-containing protein [Oscillospiraceae bacterium]